MTTVRTSIRLFALAVALNAPTPARADETTAAQADPADAAADAIALARSGRHDEAIALWRAAHGGFVEDGDLLHAAQSARKIAESLQATGKYQEARAELESLLKFLGDREPTERGASHVSLAIALESLDDSAEAEMHLGRAREIARAADNAELDAVALVNLGDLLAARMSLADAIQSYLEGAQQADRAFAKTLSAVARVRAAALLSGRDSAASQVVSLLEAAERTLSSEPSSEAAQDAWLEAGRLRRQRYASAPDEVALRRAYEALSAAQGAAVQLGDVRAQAVALIELASLYETSGRSADAAELAKRAELLAAQARSPEVEYRAQWQQGRLHAALGKDADAVTAYERATASLASIRAARQTTGRAPRVAFEDDIAPVYYGLVDLLLRPVDHETIDANQARLAKARSAIESLKAAELRDYFRDECVDRARARVRPIDQMTDRAVVLYPIVLDDRLELIVSTKHGFHQATVDVGRSDVLAAVRSLRALVEKRTTRQYLPFAQKLYSWLIKPIESHLADPEVETIVFVPDLLLGTVPMAALHNGTSFLVERFSTAIAPGIDLVAPGSLDPSQQRLFLGGIAGSVAGFAPLPHVADEIRAIHAMRRGRVLLDSDFRRDRIRRELEEHDFNIVHLASHGVLAGSDEDSYILTWDGRLTAREIGDLVGLFAVRDVPIELLVLSACETAADDDYAALGLAGLAVRSGARSAVGSLWLVGDIASARLMELFYSRLGSPGTSRAEALRAAQRAVMAEEATSHPAFWAGQILISNWQ